MSRFGVDLAFLRLTPRPCTEIINSMSAPAQAWLAWQEQLFAQFQSDVQGGRAALFRAGNASATGALDNTVSQVCQRSASQQG